MENRHPRPELSAFLREIFFEHPWRASPTRSLAYVAPDGRLVGCIGAMARPMWFDGRPIRAVVTHDFLLDPAYRGSLAALELLRAVTAGDQDLTLAEGTDAVRDLAVALGAVAVRSRSSRWVKVFRPCALGARMILHGRVPSRVLDAARGVARVPDWILTRLPGSPVRAPLACDPDQPAQPAELHELADALTGYFRLRPHYSPDALEWLFAVLERSRRAQTLRARIVPGPGSRGLGWYVYLSRQGGVGRVLQMGAAPCARRAVLGNLFRDAYTHGNVALSGATDPWWSEALSASGCRMGAGRSWVIAHASDSRLREILHGPDAFLGRLEGEGWLRFAF